MVLRWRDWLKSDGFHLAMVPVGYLTAYARMFIKGTKEVTSASGTKQTLNVGTTIVTAGYSGYTLRESPELGFQTSMPTKPLPLFAEYKLWFNKLYRISQDKRVFTHPVLNLSHKPLTHLGEYLTRAYDKRIKTRACWLTKVNPLYIIKNDICFSFQVVMICLAELVILIVKHY